MVPLRIMERGKIIYIFYLGECFCGRRSSISGNDLDQEMSGVKRRMVAKGFVITAFGAGLFLAYCFPSKFIIIALAVMMQTILP